MELSVRQELREERNDFFLKVDGWIFSSQSNSDHEDYFQKSKCASQGPNQTNRISGDWLFDWNLVPVKHRSTAAGPSKITSGCTDNIGILSAFICRRTSSIRLHVSNAMGSKIDHTLH